MSSPETAIANHWPAAVIMERTALDNRWATEQWQAKGIVPDLDPKAAPRVILQRPDQMLVLFSGLSIALHRDEAEGYHMNITSPQPKVFVWWRLEDELARPQRLSVSYNEGVRWMDSGETIDGVHLPVELLPWLAQYCALHYQPEPRKKAKYATNKDKGRMGNWRPD